MSGPSTVYLWDTNKTHVVATTGGHQTDGFANNEIPGSGEENYWKGAVSDWLTYFKNKSTPDGLEQFIPPATSAVDPLFGGQQDLTQNIYALALDPGGAYARQGSAANKIQIAPGTLLQRTSSGLLAHTFAGTEEVTIANGDGSHPRVDLIQMKISLDSTTQNTTAAISVKTGTPAVQPAYPTPDAGYVPLFGVVVGTAWAGATSNTNLFHDTASLPPVVHDLRWPLKVRAYKVKAKDFLFDSTQWSFANTLNEILIKGTGSAGMVVMCPTARSGRLLGVEIGSKGLSGANIFIARRNYTDGATTTVTTTVDTLSDLQGIIPGISQYQVNTGMPSAFENASVPTAGPVVLGTSWAGPITTLIGPPAWTSGDRGPVEKARVESSPRDFSGLCLYITGVSTSASLSHVTFYITEGL